MGAILKLSLTLTENRSLTGGLFSSVGGEAIVRIAGNGH